MHQVIARLFHSKLTLIATVTLLVYALLGFLLLPYLIERFVPVYAQEQLQRQASVGKVHANPFLLSLEISDFSLQEADGQPIATAAHLLVNFQTTSLFRWAWTFGDLTITGLDLHWAIDENGRSNLGKLADAFPADEDAAETPSAPTRFLLQHAQLIDGKLTYSDESLTTPASTTLAPINLELHDLSTLPEQRSPYAIIATLPEGGRLVWHGEISLAPISSEGEVYISGFKPTAHWSFLQDHLRLATPEGVLELYTRYNYAYTESRSQFGLQNIFFNVTDLNLSEAGKNASLLHLESFAARGGNFDLARRELSFPKVAVRNGQIAATILQDGSTDWARLVKPTQTSSTDQKTPASQTDATTPWQISLDALHFERLGIQIKDLSRGQPLALGIENLDARTQLTTSIGATTSTIADKLDVQLADVALKQSESEPLIMLADLKLSGGRVNTSNREITAQQLRLRGGNSNLIFDTQGKLTLTEALNTTAVKADKDSGAATPDESATDMRLRQKLAAFWKLRLEKLHVEDFRTSFIDQRYQPTLRYDLEDFSASIKQLDNSGTQAADFETSVRIAQGGTLSASGTFMPDGSRVSAGITADKVSLKPLKSLIEHYTTLTLQSGEASLATQLSIEKDKNKPALQISGAANIDNLLLDETLSGDRFLSWQSLATKDLDFSLSPDHLTIKQLRVVQPGAKILVFKDRSLNLGKIIKQDSSATDKQPAADDSSFPVTIERIRIEKGNMDFSDLSLVLPFAAKIEDLNGSITGISPESASRANIKLEGRVDEYGSVQIDGGLSPNSPKQYTDIRTQFRNIEMTPLSAYTATFAGRKIASGKLSLDLEYNVKNNELNSNNTIVLDRFTLGEPIDSPDALDLPLDLAIALLTDSQGKINTAIPVTGNVDSPTFSYSKVIGQAITGALVKIVTAPFRALGGLLGGSSEKLDTVSFDAGDAAIKPPQIEILKKVGEALQKRPQLALTVSGRYDPQLDSTALRADRVRRELAEGLGIALDADEDAPPAAGDQAKTQRELEKLLEARAGNKATDNFKSSYEKTAGRVAEPVNPALALLGKASPDVEYYQAMFDHLVQLQPLDDADLRALAQRRSDSIIQTLITQAGLTENRVTPGKIETTRGDQKNGIESKLILKAGPVATP